DLVCRGSVLEIREAAERNGLPRNSRAAMAVLDLIRCYKGSIPAHGVRVDFTLPASPDTYAPAFWLEKGEYALFSLKKQGQDFTFVGSTYGKVKVSRLIKPNTDAGSGLEADLEAGLSDPDPSLVIANLELLMGMGEVHSTAAIRPLIINSNPEVRGTASLALMKLGDYSMLQEVVSFLALNLSYSQKSLLQNPIRNEFEHIKDPKTLAVLHRNLYSPTLLVRSAMVKGMK